LNPISKGFPSLPYLLIYEIIQDFSEQRIRDGRE
jgi:hypothetical protein